MLRGFIRLHLLVNNAGNYYASFLFCNTGMLLDDVDTGLLWGYHRQS